MSFAGSKIIWEYYPGQGIEIQWLATFGEANGYYLSGHENANLRQLLDEVIPLATQRAGGHRVGVHVPASTAARRRGRAASRRARRCRCSRARGSRFKEPAYLTAAQQALGVFETPPPQGVRVKTPAGALYAEYTYAPSDRILNGFIQSLVGLYDYTSITQDPLGLALFEAGDAEARAIVPLLRHRRVVDVRPVRRIQPQLPRTAHRIPAAPVRTHEQGRADRARDAAADEHRPHDAHHSYDDHTHHHDDHRAIGNRRCESLCKRIARALGADEHAKPGHADPGRSDLLHDRPALHRRPESTPPAISLLSTRLPAGARAGVQISLSKIATVKLTVRQGAQVVWTNSATLERGKPRLLWITPAKGGSFSIDADRHRPRRQLLDGQRHRSSSAVISLACPRLD